MSLLEFITTLISHESPDSLRRENTTLHRIVEATGKDMKALEQEKTTLERRLKEVADEKAALQAQLDETATLFALCDVAGKEVEQLQASHDGLEHLYQMQVAVIASMEKDTAEYLTQYCALKASHTTQAEVITELSISHTALLEEMSALRVERDRLKERRGRVIQLDELEVRDGLIDDCLALLSEIDISTKVRGGTAAKAALEQRRGELTERWDALKS